MRFLFVNFCLVSFALNVSICIAQEVQPRADLILLKHYSLTELEEIQSNAQEKYTTLVYYYTQSFTISSNEYCKGCSDNFIETFDVFEYEKFRQKDKTKIVPGLYKEGYTVTLLPINQLLYTLPIHQQ